jgi:hypothetical protein
MTESYHEVVTGYVTAYQRLRLELERRADLEGSPEFQASHGSLAKAIGCSASRLPALMQRLEDAGIIRREPFKNTFVIALLVRSSSEGIQEGDRSGVIDQGDRSGVIDHPQEKRSGVIDHTSEGDRSGVIVSEANEGSRHQGEQNEGSASAHVLNNIHVQQQQQHGAGENVSVDRPENAIVEYLQASNIAFSVIADILGHYPRLDIPTWQNKLAAIQERPGIKGRPEVVLASILRRGQDVAPVEESNVNRSPNSTPGGRVPGNQPARSAGVTPRANGKRDRIEPPSITPEWMRRELGELASTN